MDHDRETPERTIVRKFLYGLPSGIAELARVSRSNTLEEAIDAAISAESSKRMRRKKRDEAHLLEMIGDLKEEIQVLKAEF